MHDVPEGWKWVTLGEAGQWLSGGTPRTSEPSFWGGDIPWISAASLTNFFINDSERRVTSLGAANGTRLAGPGALIFVVRGMSLKSEFRLGVAQRQVAFGQDCKAVIARQDIDPLYLGYAVRSRSAVVLGLVDEAGHGTGRLATDRIAKLLLPLPPLLEQQGIAKVLGDIDRKIETNGSTTRTVRQAAQVVLQHRALLAQRAALGAFAEVRKGLSYKGAGLAESGMPMVNLANAAAFGGFKRTGWKYYTGDYKPRHVARGGDLLVANTEQTWRNEILGWPMLVPDDVDEVLFSQDISIIDFRSEWRHLRLPTWAHLFTTEARQRVDGMAYGTTVARFPAEALTGLEVPVLDASDPVLEQAEALLARAWAAERESAALAQLRDALLPALMSGQLRVREAEELVGEAV